VIRLLLSCLAAALTTVAATEPQATQLAPTDPSRIETKHLTLTMSTSAATVAPGKPVSLYVDVVPKAKMHVYAPDQTDYIPIELKVDTASGYRAQAIRYPASEQFYFEPLKETQRVYSKSFRITQPITVAQNAGSTLTVKGTVRYQACDDAICYLPQTVGVSWKVVVKKSAR
jgi:DsbC/DsbD-like thiol-disulfide interchange protein